MTVYIENLNLKSFLLQILCDVLKQNITNVNMFTRYIYNYDVSKLSISIL